MRLFVALDLPESIRTELAGLGLNAARGIRPVSPDQMHITLHFLGDIDAGQVQQALGAVGCAPLRVSLNGVGRFRLNGGRAVLWAGVQATDELLELHAACERALRAIGYRPERRRYMPHVTLARLQPFADKSVLDAFLSASEDRNFGSFVAERFVLYNSVNKEDGARYEVVASWPLRA